MAKKLILYSLGLLMPYFASAGSTTVYKITGDAATVDTEVKDIGPTYDKLLTTYLSDRLISAIKDLNGVSSVQFTKGEETTAENSYYSYKTKTRKSNLFLTMNVPARVSFLLGVEESYNECTKEKANNIGLMDESGYSSSSCTLNSKIKITGPLSVYGSFAVSSLVGFGDDDLKDLQDISIDLSKSYNNKDLNLKSKFNVNSMLFEQTVARFFKAFNVQGVDMSVVGMSRQNILLGSSRIIRMLNEKIIDEKAGGK